MVGKGSDKKWEHSQSQLIIIKKEIWYDHVTDHSYGNVSGIHLISAFSYEAFHGPSELIYYD